MQDRGVSNNRTKMAIAILFLALAVFYYKYHYKVEISSDTTTMIPVAVDFLNGNYLLKGWIMGTNNFIFTDTIFYMLGIGMGMTYKTLLYLIPSVTYSFIVMGSVYIFVCRTPQFYNQPRKIITAVIGTAAIIGLMIQSSYTLLNANSHNGLYALMLICYWLVYKVVEDEKYILIVYYIALASLLYYSDTMTLLVLFAPVVIYCLYDCYTEKTVQKQCITIILATALSYVGGRGIASVIARLGGLTTNGLPIHIVAPKQIPNRVIDYLKHICILWEQKAPKESMNFGESISIYYLIIFLYMMLYVCILLWKLVEVYRKNISKEDMILLLITVLNIIGCIFTDTDVFYRYLVPAYIFGNLLMIKNLVILLWGQNPKIKFKKWGRVILLLTLGVIVIQRGIKIYQKPEESQIEVGKEINEFIKEKSYGNGYGSFWCASLISFCSDFETGIYPIVTRNGEIIPHDNLIRKDWYKEDDKHFIILWSDNEVMCNKEIVYSIIGMPDEEHTIGRYEILYWDKDISSYITVAF